MEGNINVSGVLEFTLTKADGSVETYQSTNLVVATGLNHIVRRMLGSPTPPTAMSHMAIGTGAVAAAAANTALGTQASIVALSSSTLSGNNAIIYSATFSPGSGVGAITEAGIFNAATAGVMLCRSVFSQINKGAEDTLTITWTVTIGA